eukprot:3835789-Prymnesium_polylepis.1
MDPQTKAYAWPHTHTALIPALSCLTSRAQVIDDPRRLLNCDETPQPVDAPQKGSRPKVAKHSGKAVRKATTTSKDITSSPHARTSPHGVGPLGFPLRPAARAQAQGAARQAGRQPAAGRSLLRRPGGPRAKADAHLHLLAHGRRDADAGVLHPVPGAARPRDHRAQRRGGGGGRRADQAARGAVPGQPRVALLGGGAQGRVGSIVAPRHSPVHRGADDLGLPPVTRPVQCHLPPPLQSGARRVQGGVQGAL